jgi:hypothetical protein
VDDVATSVGERFARALAAQDAGSLRSVLSDVLDFEGLTPGRHWRASTAAEAVDDVVLGHWFGPGDDVRELRSVTTGQVGDRERVAYRLGVRRDGIDYVVEQQAYYRSDGERIDWMRVLCSGYRPEVAPDC